MSSTNLAPRNTELAAPEDLGMSLSLAIDPVKALNQAQSVGEAIRPLLERKDKDGQPLFYIDMGKSRHAKFELWQLVAFCFGVTTRLVSVCSVYDEMSGASGFEAVVETLHGNRIVGQAAARCLNNEDNWSKRAKYERVDGQRGEKTRNMVAVPSYQLESMAQTRAASKALASHFRWVLILAGFSGTPAEEMGDKEPAEPGEEGASTAAAEGPAERISEKQRKIVFGAMRSHQYPQADLPGLLKRHGFNIVAEVTTDKFPAIIKEIESYKAPAS